MPTVYLGNLVQVPSLLKIIEIVLLSIVLAVARTGSPGVEFGWHMNRIYFGAGICVGYMLVNMLLLICYAFGDLTTQRSSFELLLCFVGSLLFSALCITVLAGVADSDYFPYYPYLPDPESKTTKIVVEGIFLILTAACLLFDAVLVARRIRPEPNPAPNAGVAS